LGFETANQYEFQVRARPSRSIALRVGAYVKQLDGLVASIPLGVDPDSAIFGNGDYGNVKGLEVTLEREFRDWLGFRVTYVLQKADASASDARDLYRRLQITPVGDTILPATAQFPLDYDRRHSFVALAQVRLPRAFGRVFAGTEFGAVGRWGSGLPYSRITASGDSLLGLPNTFRLPSAATLDLFLRRTLGMERVRLGLFVDLRNVTNERNILAVRRDSGEPHATEGQIQAMAEAAYAENPQPIPYESRRYRPWADLNRDGLVSGPEELMPLYERAARDIAQPLFYYGNPRLIRFGAELFF
jgi:outer membrane receptor protein involved in Fe transport